MHNRLIVDKKVTDKAKITLSQALYISGIVSVSFLG